MLGSWRHDFGAILARQAHVYAIPRGIRGDTGVIEHHRQHGDRFPHRLPGLPLGDELTDERRNLRFRLRR